MAELRPIYLIRASLATELVKNLPAMQEIPVCFLGWEDPLEEGSQHLTLVFLPGEAQWAKEPGGLQSMGSQRIRLD